MARDDLDRLTAALARRNPAAKALIRAAKARQLFGRTLERKRKALGLTQTEVAARMKTSTAVVGRIELGGDVQLTTLERYTAG